MSSSNVSNVNEASYYNNNKMNSITNNNLTHSVGNLSKVYHSDGRLFNSDDVYHSDFVQDSKFLKLPKLLKAKQNYSLNNDVLSDENLKRNSSNFSLSSDAITASKPQGLVLSWENINVFNKRKLKLVNLFRRKTNVGFASDITNSETNLTKSNSTLIPTDSSSVSTISYSKTSTETNSLDSVYSTTSSTKVYKNDHILVNISGLVSSGECMAIMGASGSGKTTLLNVLNFRNLNKFNIKASIKINGKEITASDLMSKSAYVQQDDLFISNLTVREHLTFLAMLKINSGFSKREKTSRVNEIIKEFNLEKCKNTKIGTHDNKKGISGGEKRRLSFASEILTDPLILFCDEPTSGLDSHMALTIVNTLSNLAKKGKTIICTIHQPSSQVFDRFDKLCLLAEGRVAYFGDREQAFDFFKSISYNCPIKYNPADYYIEILALKSNNTNNYLNIQSICNSFEKSAYNAKIQNEIKQIQYKYKVDYDEDDFKKERKFKKYKTSYFNQFIWLLWRQSINTAREPFATRTLVIQAIVIGLFLGFTYFQQKFDQPGIQNKNGLLFMTLMQTCLTYLFGVASQYHEQWGVTYRDIKNRVYSIAMYHLAKTLSELPQNVIFPIITVTIIYWLANIHPSSFVYFSITSIMVIASNTAVGFGAFLAVSTPSINATMGLIGPTFFPLLIFSGFLINANSVPVYFIWIKYISWMFYANESIMILLWRNVDEISCPYLNNQPMGNSSNMNPSASARICLINGREVLDQLSMDEKNFLFDVLMLIGMLVLWHALAGLIVYIRSKR